MSNNVKLSNFARDTIVKSAIADAFKSESLAVKKRMSAFAMRCYRANVSAAQEAKARLAPEEFLNLTNSFSLNVYKGTRCLYEERNVEVAKAMPFHARVTTGYVKVSDDALYDEYTMIVAERDAIKENISELKGKVRQMVYSTTSLNKLIELWPEVIAFLPADLTAPKSYLPATLAPDINSALKKAGIKVALPKKVVSTGLVLVAA
jgi:hypothetical protein